MFHHSIKKYLHLFYVLILLGCSNGSDDGNDDNPDVQTYLLSVSSSPLAGGSVSITSGTYNEGSVVSIQAIPSSGFSFREWTGAVQSTNNPVSVRMNSNKNITAVFDEIASDADGDGVSDDDDLCDDTPGGVEVDEDGCPLSPIYLAENGVTIKCYEWGQVGDTGEINGITYTIVNGAMLRTLVENDEDVTRVCTTKVSNMDILFAQKEFFNQNINSWDVGNVETMDKMFLQAENFNQPLNSWDVSKVRNMEAMFESSGFNQSLKDWDVSNVINMNYIFRDSDFNQDISTWDVSNITSMEFMFSGSQFNQDISAWNVSNVTNMEFMFNDTPFNQDISGWNVSKVIYMSVMFYNTPFNQDISRWNVGNVKDMRGMFWGSQFNQNISGWNVSNVVIMESMFSDSQFNQDLSGWNVNNVVNCIFFDNNTPQWTLPKPNFPNCSY